MEIFHRYTDQVQQVSIDEAYLDVTENKMGIPSATWIAERIRKEIFETCRVTASAGVSYNKFLAKIASEMNKPDGMMVIPPEKAQEVLENLPIGKFHGIGKSTETRMKYLGINTGADMKKLTIHEMIQHFGKSGVFYYNIVRGIDTRKVETEHVRKSISTERTFSKDISDLPEIMLALEQTANRLADRMAELDIAGKTISIKVKYNDFTLINRSATIKKFTNDRSRIFRYARRLFNESWAPGRRIRLVGICISTLNTDEDCADQLVAPFFSDCSENMDEE
jgi:DNA polymerase-4